VQTLVQLLPPTEGGLTQLSSWLNTTC
jgi:hypothetical protein